MALEQSERRHWVGIDLGGTKIMALLLDADFRVLAAERKKTKGMEGPDAFLARVGKIVQDVLEKGGGSVGELAGIGLGCAGPLDLERGILLEAPNLGWREIPLRETLERVFQCLVVVTNDVDAGTYGEFRFGTGQGARCVVGAFLGTGIGAGCVYEGQLLRGRIASCMEIGHLPMRTDGPLCGCGQRGCLEAMAGRLAIAGEAAVAAQRGQAPHLLERCGTDLASIRSGDLASVVRVGDTAIEEIIRQAARTVGIALAGVVNLLAPDLLILGGGLVEAMPELFLEEITAVVKSRAMAAFTQSLRVERAALGDQATALGAAALAADRQQSGKREVRSQCFDGAGSVWEARR
ncbi:MAG: ROK family protein [Chloroflexi bacterium]|nr:ROK family protein [Chloroflexota bacterium]